MPSNLAPAAVLRPITKLEPRCVCIDIETPHTGEAVLHKLAAFRSDTGRRITFEGRFSGAHVRMALDDLANGAEFILGHNIRRHDIPVLAQLFPRLKLLELPVVDTLELSPLAFPENPYHRLVKDYKLVSDARSHPLRDAELSFELFASEIEALRELQAHRPDDVALFHYLLAGDACSGLAPLFAELRGAPRPTDDAAAEHLRRAIRQKVCSTRLCRLIGHDLFTPALRFPLAYSIAWLRVSGSNSVLPPWVHRTFRETGRLIRELREVPCSDPDCAYCGTTHDPEAQLRTNFNLEAFRPRPPNASGGSLQRDVVVGGLRGENLLAILPTGAGKSVCFQLPALAHYWRTGALTVVVSPLQSLMKDQVDNLIRRGIYCAVAVNGLLTPPERRAALERIRLGDAGIVFVSPEQFRNKSFREAIRWREIGAWVFDEAHCLSKWGHDFRTDYLHVSRFIREQYPDPLPPIACFTATAKPDVIADLREHFRAELGTELAQYAAKPERPNLAYEVVSVSKSEKPARILALLEADLGKTDGAAVVFAATRRNAETLAELIAAAGWSCAHFHAGLEPGTKRDLQQRFITGALRIIVATNAFGMGVDKPDIRLVVHADIPGSLENYLQEAGRAGRDGAAARCVLLFDEEDVERQFGLSARSRLTQRDFITVLKALRKRKTRVGDDAIVVTARELLLGDDLDSPGIDPEDPDADTKVKTAIAWLERARFLRREANETRVFSSSLKVATLAEADSILAHADLSEAVRERYRTVLGLVMGSTAAEGISTDELLVSAGIPAAECFRTLHNLEALGLLANDLGLRVVLRKGVTDPSDARFVRVCRIERALVELMAEAAPEADITETQVVSLRPLCEGVRRRLAGTISPEEVVPERLLDLLRASSQSFGEGSGKRAMLSMRKVGSLELRVRVQRPWSQIREITGLRQAVAQVLLQALLAKLPEGLRSADAVVECKAGDLLHALASDLALAPRLLDPATALEQALLYLHETDVLILDKGRTVFRSAMTVRLLPRDAGGRFLKEDFAPLERHYGERNFQIHVMHEYARRALKKMADALVLVAAYFSTARERFIREHFAGGKELLEFATTAESYQRIVESLRHPVQQHLVQAREGVNRLVLAGPGSGKTRVIVHRVGYLLRVLRVAPESIIVLAFNRSAAVEVRRRLRELVGSDAAGVAVLTYHALALRLTGMSLGALAEAGKEPDFDAVLRGAVDLLEGRVAAGSDPDELRDRLLTGYRFILVDEYQDTDALQYELVSALAGRTRQEGDTKLTIMAVGDDDQNIYSFRSTSVEFIRRFEDDYKAEKSYLVENFRSTQHIIAAANTLIQRAPGRMKVDHPILINHARASAPAGGRFARLDPASEGRAQLFRVPLDRNVQAQLAMAELERLRTLDGDADWSRFAVLARTHATLEPIRAYCERNGIPYRTGDPGGGLVVTKTREGHLAVAALRRRHACLVRTPALVRWLSRLAAVEPTNPWFAELRDSARDLEAAVGGAAIPRPEAIDWIFESAGAYAREAPGHLNLLTAHGAKGREFAHVLVMDGGDWPSAAPDERRLLYVAMTRAKETLTVFQAQQRGNPMLDEFSDCESVWRVEPRVLPMPMPELDRLHRELTLRDVDLGYAGRSPKSAAIHRTLAELKVGATLLLEKRALRNNAGCTVGHLAKSCDLPPGRVVSAHVSAIVPRTKAQTPPQYQSSLHADEWEVVLAEIVLVRTI
ncbi:MAG: RecQ family ATP-dependent DNA helicase [Betaproteobacteria bacterium]|nr:RecQ family ATP-dependent DNA helicase [Betaproteobacteria bacterium]